MYRRDFLSLAPAAVAAPPAQFLKGICGIIFPPGMPLEQQFQAAKNAGFSGIEIRLASHFPVDTPLSQAARIAASARKHGIAIISIWAADPLVPFPLNHPDPSVRDKGVQILHTAIDLAKALHCGAVKWSWARRWFFTRFEVRLLGTGIRFVLSFPASGGSYFKKINISAAQL